MWWTASRRAGQEDGRRTDGRKTTSTPPKTLTYGNSCFSYVISMTSSSAGHGDMPGTKTMNDVINWRYKLQTDKACLLMKVTKRERRMACRRHSWRPDRENVPPNPSLLAPS